jgi:hypothetical protein
MSLFGFREWLAEAFAGDPPRPPSVADYCTVEQERINLEMERDAYKRELLRLGYRPELLKAMATANLVEVRAS